MKINNFKVISIILISFIIGLWSNIQSMDENDLISEEKKNIIKERLRNKDRITGKIAEEERQEQIRMAVEDREEKKEREKNTPRGLNQFLGYSIK